MFLSSILSSLFFLLLGRSILFDIPACVVLCCMCMLCVLSCVSCVCYVCCLLFYVYVMCVVSISLSYLDPEFLLGINKVIIYLFI